MESCCRFGLPASLLYAEMTRAPLTRLLAVAAVTATTLIAANPAAARKLFVAQAGSTSVSVIETTTNSLTGPSATVGFEPVSIAITPGGTRTYVVSATGANVTAIDTNTQTATATIPLGGSPDTIAITPDGSRAYISNFTGNSVQVLDVNSNTLGTPITVPAGPLGLGMTPDGSRLYVASNTNDTVSVVDTAAGAVTGAPIPVGNNPIHLAVTPDGSKVYVSNANVPDSVSVISTGSNTVTQTINMPAGPSGIATAPSGRHAYVGTAAAAVNTIDVLSDTLVAPTFAQASGTSRVAVTPAGTHLYASDSQGINGTVGAFDALSGTPAGSVTLQSNPEAMAIVPDQGPTARYSKKPGPAGSPTTFDGTGSSDSDGTIARYDWNFGDGTTVADGGPKPSHVYARKGKYTATLTVTDDEGTSTQDVYTGRSLLRNGRSEAADSDTFTVPNFAFTATARRTQRVVRQRGVKVTAGCTHVGCDTTISGSITLSKRARSSATRRLKLRSAKLSLTAGTKRTVKLKLSRRSVAKLRRALRQRRKASARVKLSLVDKAGDRASKTLRVRAKR